MVLPRFARAAVCGEPLTVHGDGRQTRCFLHVEEAARLASVAVNGKRLAAHGGAGEARQHHAVAIRLPRPDDIPPF